MKRLAVFLDWLFLTLTLTVSVIVEGVGWQIYYSALSAFWVFALVVDYSRLKDS